MNFAPKEFLSFEQKLKYLADTPTDDTQKDIVGYQSKMAISLLTQLLIMDLVVKNELAPRKDGGFAISDSVKPGASIRIEVPTATHIKMNDSTLESIVRSVLEAGKVGCDVSVRGAVIVLKRASTAHQVHLLAS